MEVYLAKGFSGGGRSFSRSSSRSSSSSRSKSSSSKTKTSTKSKTTSKPKTSSKPGTSTAKPGSKIKTANGKTVQSSAQRPANHKYSNSKGVVGDNGYTPRFTSGYVAPAGSVVYYPSHGMSDYLLWAYIFSHDSPRDDQTVVVQPDGKQVSAKPVSGGTDGMLIFNWLLLIIIVCAAVAGVVYLVNKLTSRKPSYA